MLVQLAGVLVVVAVTTLTTWLAVAALAPPAESADYDAPHR